MIISGTWQGFSVPLAVARALDALIDRATCARSAQIRAQIGDSRDKSSVQTIEASARWDPKGRRNPESDHVVNIVVH
jgi:hypothetical protein